MQDYSQILSARGWAFPPAGHSSLETAEADYHARVEAALQVVCRPDYPVGMVPWLQKADPALYEELTCRLPDLIHQLWTAHAPVEEFQSVVDTWLDAHRRGCDLYRGSRNPRERDGGRQ